MSFRLKVQFKIVVKLAYCVSNINFPAAHSQRSFFGKTWNFTTSYLILFTKTETGDQEGRWWENIKLSSPQ